MKIKPLPCPFCGHAPKFRRIPKEIAQPEIPNGYWTLGCDNRKHNCEVAPSAFGDTKAEAVTNWNTRPNMNYDRAFFKSWKEQAIRLQNFDLASALRTLEKLCS